MHDIAIIGAGPAGSTLARLLGGKYRVLLADRREMDPSRPSGGKCCGGLVAPDAQKAIAELGLGLPSGVVVGPQLFAVRTIDLAAKRERFYQRFYINIDRAKFDCWLVSLASGADTRFGFMFKGFERSNDGFDIRFTHNGKEYMEKARVLVGADGASSPVRRLAAPEWPSPARYVAIQEWFRDSAPAPYFSAIFDPDTTDFYCWTIPKEDMLLVGAALRPGPDASSRFEQFKRKLPAWGFDLGSLVKREGAEILRPLHARQIATGENGVVLVGEAAGFISPSSCEGLSYAFRSASALARSLEPGLAGFEARYAREVSGLRRNIVLKNLKSPFMCNPFLRSMVMKTGLSSLEIAGRVSSDV